jgi:hypothetical protein
LTASSAAAGLCYQPALLFSRSPIIADSLHEALADNNPEAFRYLSASETPSPGSSKAVTAMADTGT